jgi:arsenate reductase
MAAPPVPADVTIFHNPACSVSRNVVALLRANGVEPRIVDYMKVGWTRGQLESLLSRMGSTAKDILRVRGTQAADLGLTAKTVLDGDILNAMVRDPSLVQRPIVVSPRGSALCRPKEKVLDLL